MEGTFAFVAGQVAHTGEGLKINTPVATMGVRGTVGLFRSEPTVINSNLGHVWSVFLHEDIDGSHHLGRIALIDQDPTSPTFGQTFYLLDSRIISPTSSRKARAGSRIAARAKHQSEDFRQPPLL